MLALDVVAVLLFAGCSAVGTGSAGPGIGVAGPFPWPATPDWQQYVQAPSSRHVIPVRVVSATGGVGNPQALVHPGSGQETTLTLAGGVGLHDGGPDGWPTGTVATASSFHTCCSGAGHSFVPANALDGNPATYWNNANVASAHSWLEVSTPAPVTLPGVTLQFSPNGVPVDFQIQTWTAATQSWSTQATVTGNQNVSLAAKFPSPVTTQHLRVQITLDQATSSGQFSRIAELYPDYYLPTTLVLDYGKEVGGIPKFQVVKASGDPVFTASYSESLRYMTLTGDVGPAVPRRSKTLVVTSPGLVVSTMIQGGERYEELALTTPGTITLNAVWIHFTPFLGTASTLTGHFVCSSHLLNQLWYDGAYTTNMVQLPAGASGNTSALLLDGAKRDRMVWEGDLSVTGPTLYYTSDAAEYMKDSLRLLGSYQLTSGFVEGVQSPDATIHTGTLIPGTTANYSASYSMYWVVNLATYYHYTGDAAFVQQEWPAVQRELAWNATQVDAQGLFVTNSADGNNWHYTDLTGAQTYYNVLYYRSLVDGAALAAAAGHPQAASAYRTEAGALRTAINRYLLDSATGVYNVSEGQSGYVVQDANVWAVLYGVAPPNLIAGILQTLQQRLNTPYGALDVSSPPPSGYNPSSMSTLIGPFMGSYELWAMFAAHDTAGALALMRTEWGPMTQHGPADTFWEVMNGNGAIASPQGGPGTSLAHGWSTGPTAALSRYTLGIAPVAAGYATWLVEPHPGTLSWAEGQAPTPHGPLVVKWGKASSGHFVLEVEAPRTTTGSIGVPTSGRAVNIWVNGRLVWSAGVFHAVSGVTGAVHTARDVLLQVRPSALAAKGGRFLVVAQSVAHA